MIYNIIYEADAKSEDSLILRMGLRAYAKEKRGHKDMESFAFFLRDENDQTQGGCDGIMYYGCLFVSQLWINASLRHQGYGTKLMQKAEQLAKEKGCLFATVNTMDWEALDFYRKLGYKVEFERKGYLKNSIFYFLRKDF